MALVEYLERITRGQVPDEDDHESDGPLMSECMTLFCADLRVLTAQAGAGWSPNFAALLNPAEAMRCVEIELEDIEPTRVEHTLDRLAEGDSELVGYEVVKSSEATSSVHYLCLTAY